MSNTCSLKCMWTFRWNSETLKLNLQERRDLTYLQLNIRSKARCIGGCNSENLNCNNESVRKSCLIYFLDKMVISPVSSCWLRTNLAFSSSLECKYLVNYKDSKMTFMDVFLTAFFLTFSINCPVGMAFLFTLLTW